MHRLQLEYEQCKSVMSAALETERKTTSDLSEKLEEEERQHANTHSLLEQVKRTHTHALTWCVHVCVSCACRATIISEFFLLISVNCV